MSPKETQKRPHQWSKEERKHLNSHTRRPAPEYDQSGNLYDQPNPDFTRRQVVFVGTGMAVIFTAAWAAQRYLPDLNKNIQLQNAPKVRISFDNQAYDLIFSNDDRLTSQTGHISERLDSEYSWRNIYFGRQHGPWSVSDNQDHAKKTIPYRDFVKLATDNPKTPTLFGYRLTGHCAALLTTLVPSLEKILKTTNNTDIQINSIQTLILQRGRILGLPQIPTPIDRSPQSSAFIFYNYQDGYGLKTDSYATVLLKLPVAPSSVNFP